MGSMDFPRISTLKLKGYKAFKDFQAKFGHLEVVVGANGSGKTSLIEFFSILRDGMDREIPPGIIPGGVGQAVFNDLKDEKIVWTLGLGVIKNDPIYYYGYLSGPKGNILINNETIYLEQGSHGYRILMESKSHNNLLAPRQTNIRGNSIDIGKASQLALSAIMSPSYGTPYEVREYIKQWRFYSSFKFKNATVRRSVIVEQDATLNENASNLSSVLHFLFTEHPGLFKELCSLIRLVLPGFQSLTVKARGGPGEVMAFWREEGVDADLTLADLSDGILRFLCWAVLCLHPKPPSLICIDEPELGLHPRVLPLLAGLFRKASERTQIILSTHSSYFLSQFPLENIAVMRKEDGRAVWIKPADSPTLRDMLADFGQGEIANLHISDELEVLA